VAVLSRDSSTIGLKAIRGIQRKDSPDMDQPKIADELKKMEHEPLLPIEKKLIVWSIVSGVVLAALLLWIGHVFLS
jgi:hypothetical protein